MCESKPCSSAINNGSLSTAVRQRNVLDDRSSTMKLALQVCRDPCISSTARNPPAPVSNWTDWTVQYCTLHERNKTPTLIPESLYIHVNRSVCIATMDRLFSNGNKSDIRGPECTRAIRSRNLSGARNHEDTSIVIILPVLFGNGPTDYLAVNTRPPGCR